MAAADTWRDGQVHQMEFRDGGPTAPLKLTGSSERAAPRFISSRPRWYSAPSDFHYDILARRLRELSFRSTARRQDRPDRISAPGKEEKLRLLGRGEGVRWKYMNRAKPS